MSHAFVPYEPLNIPKPLGRDIWIVDGPEISMDFPLGLKVPFPTRMVVVRLSSGKLWLHSPIAPDRVLIDHIRSLGEPAHLIAPNSIHYWYMPEWHDIFPDAVCHYAAGIAERASSRKNMPGGEIMTGTPSAEWGDEFDQVEIAGPVVTEVIFFHRQSRTVILTDLIENFEPDRMNSFLWKVAGRFAGVLDPDGKAPADYRSTFLRNKAQLREGLAKVVDWQAENAVMAHGRPYIGDAAYELRRSFRWALGQEIT